MSLPSINKLPLLSGSQSFGRLLTNLETTYEETIKRQNNFLK